MYSTIFDPAFPRIYIYYTAVNENVLGVSLVTLIPYNRYKNVKDRVQNETVSVALACDNDT